MSQSEVSVGVSRNVFIAGIIVSILISILASSLISTVIIPNLIPKGWHEIVRFHGTDDETTEPFEINDMHWRIGWFVSFTSPAPEDAKFYFNISGIHSFSFPEIRPNYDYPIGLASIFGGEEYFTESGERTGGWSLFHFHVFAEGVESWSIVVESYH